MRIQTGLSFSLVLALAGCAATGTSGMLAAESPRALPESGPVSVHWNDPSTFTELRHRGNRRIASDGNWLQELAQYMRKRAQKQLTPGERLDLTIVDVDLAGEFEPWHGFAMQDTRIVRDLYPPRITMQYRRYDAGGVIVAEGERKLTDPAFMLGASPSNDTDPLRYEKRLIDYWLRRELDTAAR